MMTLQNPPNGATVCLQTEPQAQFYRDESRRAQIDGALTYAWDALVKQGEDRSLPAPVAFSWEEHDAEQSGASFYLLVSESADMAQPWVYITNATTHEVYNLKVGTQYFWCVQKNGRRSEVHSFYTSATLPRCIRIDGISNVRDMGGYAVDGGRIRQGLVYRGGEFELHMHLGEDGARELVRLGIRTELDMRGEAVSKVDFGTAEAIGIKRVLVPSVPYAPVFNREFAQNAQDFFKVFANPESYPIYYHCWGGADRTGTFAFILGAYLGMRLEDLIDEYEFTSLSSWGIRTRNFGEFRNFLQLFMALDGKNLQEKATNFLKNHAGLCEAELETIKEIMVEAE